MKPIILIDHESNDLFIAEIEKEWDIEKLEKENEKLNDEYCDYDNPKYEWTYSDYYEELGYRTWINIYKADLLYV